MPDDEGAEQTTLTKAQRHFNSWDNNQTAVMGSDGQVGGWMWVTEHRVVICRRQEGRSKENEWVMTETEGEREEKKQVWEHSEEEDKQQMRSDKHKESDRQEIKADRTVPIKSRESLLNSIYKLIS